MANVSNIFVDQGSTFTVTIDVTDNSGGPFDLTDYSAQAQIRKTYTSVNPTATFSVSVNVANSTVTLSLTDTVTSALEHGRYVYDCIIIDQGGTKTRIVEGQATVTPGVTK